MFFDHITPSYTLPKCDLALVSSGYYAEIYLNCTYYNSIRSIFQFLLKLSI